MGGSQNFDKEIWPKNIWAKKNKIKIPRQKQQTFEKKLLGKTGFSSRNNTFSKRQEFFVTFLGKNQDLVSLSKFFSNRYCGRESRLGSYQSTHSPAWALPVEIFRLIRSLKISLPGDFRAMSGEFRRSCFCFNRDRSFRFGSDTE